MTMKNYANLIFELGQLRLEDRRGWLRLGLKTENVAEHSLRASQLAYILAKLEGHPDPNYVTTLVVFHDMAETRIGDPDMVAKVYGKYDQENVVQAQTDSLGEIGETMLAMWKEVAATETKAGKIAKDADKLEMAFTAKELIKRGYPEAQLWIESVEGALHTDSANRLLYELKNTDPTDWWKAILY